MFNLSARSSSARTAATPSAQPEPTFFEGECVEVPVLLSTNQVAALEAVARRRGITAAQLLRRIVREFTARSL